MIELNKWGSRLGPYILVFWDFGGFLGKILLEDLGNLFRVRVIHVGVWAGRGNP